MENDEPIQHSPLENPPQQAEQEAQHEWVEPIFERMTLKEAMSSSLPGNTDALGNYS